MTTNAWMKKPVAALMLVMLVMGQPGTVRADETPANASTETTVEATPAAPTVQDVLLSVCQARGYDEDCAKTLLGMVWVESNNVSTAVGDHGRARGYFQIWYKLHNISIACAEDLTCSANWTLTYLERHGYPTYVSYAVQCHNSCNAGNGYAARVFRQGERLWSTPLAITQEAPVQLATNL